MDVFQGHLRFPGDGETVVMRVDLDVFFIQTGELEHSGDLIVFRRLVDI